MELKKQMNRRKFLETTAKVSAGALAFPALVPGSALGKNGAVPPSGKVVLGCIGMGGMGNGNMNQFLTNDDARVVAVCDVDANHLRAAKQRVDEHYGNSDCKTYHDFRELIARNDIDAISLATPDHWHAIPAIMAAESGKDIYGEKPLSHCFAEGRAMCNAVKRYNRIWQTGSWQRSVDNFRFACELVINGRIGRVHKVHVGLPAGMSVNGNRKDMVVQDPPGELDYDFWLGPSHYQPYFPGRTHWNWRWQLAFGGGQFLDWIGHHLDIAHWGLGLDYTGPVEVEGTGEYSDDPFFDTAVRYRVTTTYKDGLVIILAGGHDDVRFGTTWFGEYGWVWVTRGDIDAYPKSLLNEKFNSSDIRLYRSTEHRRNFLDCVKSRKESITPCEVAHRSQSPGHLGQIAMLLGRKIRFNPDTEEILNDPTASEMLHKPMRSPWHY